MYEINFNITIKEFTQEFHLNENNNLKSTFHMKYIKPVQQYDNKLKFFIVNSKRDEKINQLILK